MEWLKKFMKEEDGVTAIEYTLIAVLIAFAIVIAVTGVGNMDKYSAGFGRKFAGRRRRQLIGV